MGARAHRFRCVECATLITTEVSPIAVRLADLSATLEPVPPGFWCRDDDRGGFVLHPDDRVAENVVMKGTHRACCDGWLGRIACANGHSVGDMAAHCWELWLRLEPSWVRCEVAPEPSRYAVVFGEAPCRSTWDVAAAIHEAMGLDDWLGTDWDALAGAVRAKAGGGVTILWVNAEESRLAGVPTLELQERFGLAGIRVMLRAGLRGPAVDRREPAAGSTTGA
jgi:hypothetical protein